jgi:uncharacterized protein YyaL (SSP411 family)
MPENLLAAEQSPYLRQHADNPVAWYPWGDAAFERARELNRPVFLSIGYATCHWCHVMAHESFEDESVAELLNQHFVSIKVDREERPDVDSVYMTVCQMMTGHGGWPLTVVLTPDRSPFFVTTYVPRETRGGRIGMLDLLPRLADYWASRRNEVDRSAAEIVEALRLATSVPEGPDPGLAEVDAAVRTLRANFDAENGGFSGAPKFPSPHTLGLLLRVWNRTKVPDVLAMVTKTLESMRRGGIRDQLGGGFHRYSTDARWVLPHFEKMLYDQALLALAYTEAFTATGDPALASEARATLDYVVGELADPAGGFHSAEDADSEGEEGRFYVWSETELASVLSNQADLELAYDAYGIEPEGNYREEATGRRPGTNVLVVAELPADLAVGHGGSPEEVTERLEDIRRRLLHARGGRVRPLRDDKVLTDWNGLMIGALARAGAALDEPDYVSAATRCAEFLTENLRRNGELLHRWRASDAAIPGMADDYAFLAWGLLELHRATFDLNWLERALETMDMLLAKFEAPDGGFFGTASGGEEQLVRVIETSDGAIPSANSIAAAVLLELAHLTGRPAYEDAVHRLLTAVGGRIAGAPAAHAALLQAVDRLNGEPIQLVIVGFREDPEVEQMLALVHKRFLPRAAVLYKPIDNPEACAALAAVAPFTEFMGPVEGRATAYICRGHSCDAPEVGATALEEALSRFSERPNAV